MATRHPATLIVVSFVVLIAVAACGDDAPGPAPTATGTGSTPAATPTPEPELTSSPAPTPDTGVFTIGEPRELSSGVVLLITHGCWNCDGPDRSIDRVYQDSGGNLRFDTFSPPGIEYVLSRPAFARDGTAWMTVCNEGYCGGLGSAEPGSRAALVRSLDGGVTWETIQEFADSWVGVMGTLPGGVLLARAGRPEADAIPASTEYVLAPSGVEVPRPTGFDEHEIAPFTWRDEILWQHSDTSSVVDAEGTVAIDLLALAGLPGQGWHVRVVGELGSNSLLLLAWNDGGIEAARYLRYTDESIAPVATLPGGTAGIGFAGRLNDAVGFGNLYASVDDLRTAFLAVGSSYALEDSFDNRWQHSLPALFDFTSRTVHPLDFYGRLIGENYNDRNNVIHAVEGRFLRVETGDDDCLNVREGPSLGAAVVACYVDGVLLQPGLEVEEADGITWRHVFTPLNVEAWANAEFLEE